MIVKTLSQIIYFLLKRSGYVSLRKNNSNHSFKLGNYNNINFHPTSKVILGRNLDLRNYISILVNKNAELQLGDNFFMNNYCSINCLYSIEIGENVLFGEGVKIYDHNHEYHFANDILNVERKKFTTAAVKIGKNSWLGSNVTVLKGVTIGENSIVGAGCVVHKDIPPNSVIVNQQEIKFINKT